MRTRRHAHQLTPLMPSVRPTAISAPVMTCVVDTGRPACAKHASVRLRETSKRGHDNEPEHWLLEWCRADEEQAAALMHLDITS